nr:uncharacterized protein LOC109156886 [Ipomoea batatas]GMD88042.1 uncharacterized protein LOC109156886 [Ipomoea batatas]
MLKLLLIFDARFTVKKYSVLQNMGKYHRIITGFFIFGILKSLNRSCKVQSGTEDCTCTVRKVVIPGFGIDCGFYFVPMTAEVVGFFILAVN